MAHSYSFLLQNVTVFQFELWINVFQQFIRVMNKKCVLITDSSGPGKA